MGLRDLFPRAVVAGALGYFVDSYDLLLFTVLRVPSLRGIGVPEGQLLDVGVALFNAQLLGLMLGGVVWGVLGDKRGRVTVLFGSILVYSVANLANALVADVGTYALLRFVAGFGLAGEFGIAVTLVSEVMPAARRAWGTMLVGVVGIQGAIAAGVVGSLVDWRLAYALGGVLGLGLLALRYRMVESGVFGKARDRGVARGDLRLLFASRRRAVRYLSTVVLGVPTWFVLAIVVTLAPELSLALGASTPASAGPAAITATLGLVAGNTACAALSQRLRSRWWSMLAFLAAFPAATFALLLVRSPDPDTFYLLAGIIGVSVGYWVVFLTMAAEQFGTNLRATVVTTAPNFSRGAAVPVTLAFQALVPALGVARSTLAVGCACALVALLALRGMEEGFGRDLDFFET